MWWMCNGKKLNGKMMMANDTTNYVRKTPQSVLSPINSSLFFSFYFFDFKFVFSLLSWIWVRQIYVCFHSKTVCIFFFPSFSQWFWSYLSYSDDLSCRCRCLFLIVVIWLTIKMMKMQKKATRNGNNVWIQTHALTKASETTAHCFTWRCVYVHESLLARA